MSASTLWSEPDIQRLRELWPTAPTCRAVADALGRSTTAIHVKASKLGIRRLGGPIRSTLRPAININISNTEAAWLAGFVDGEGCIAMYPAGEGFYHTRIGIANTYLPVLTRVVDMLGGGGIRHAKRDPDAKCKDGYQWQANNGRFVQAVLTVIRPYLFIKPRQADLVLGYLDSWLALPRGQFPVNSSSVYAELKALNRKGRPITEPCVNV